MSVEMLQMISTGCFIAAGVCFVGAVMLFFILDIPKVSGEVSGRTAKKAIAEIRRQNETLKSEKPGPDTGGALHTEKFATASLAPSATTMLSEESTETVNATALLSDNTQEHGLSNKTTLLPESREEQSRSPGLVKSETVAQEFELEEEIMFMESHKCLL